MTCSNKTPLAAALQRPVQALCAIAAGLLLAACGGGSAPEATGPASPAPGTGTPQNPGPVAALPNFSATTLATGLVNPWSLAFLPDGSMLVTEKAGRLRVLSAGGQALAVVSGLPAVVDAGQGGLLDVAVAADFASTRRIYLSYAEAGSGAEAGRQGLAVGSGVLSADLSQLLGWQVLHRQVPKTDSAIHFGGRIVLAPGQLMYVTHGDRNESGRAQALDAGHGKVFRISTNGSPLSGPFDHVTGALPGLWSLGHRNIQGAALHPQTGALWVNEHGPQGGDELNLITAGGNYGWPLVSHGCEYGAPVGSCPPVGGQSSAPGFIDPVSFWVPISIAPSGLVIHSGRNVPQWQGDFFVGALAGRALWQLRMDGNTVVSRRAVLTELNERIRDVREGPDGMLYLLTDGSAGRLLRVSPAP